MNKVFDPSNLPTKSVWKTVAIIYLLMDHFDLPAWAFLIFWIISGLAFIFNVMVRAGESKVNAFQFEDSTEGMVKRIKSIMDKMN